MIKIPGHRGRPPGDHPLRRRGDQRQRHPALLGRALPGGDRGLAGRAGAAAGAGQRSRAGRLGGQLLREPGGRQGGPAARPAGRSDALRGRIAIANACAAYRLFEWSLGTPRWKRLAQAGARPQRPLWASTSTKDPRYPDTYYVEALVAPRTVNTLPPETFAAYRDHGRPAVRIHESIAAAPAQLKALAEPGHRPGDDHPGAGGRRRGEVRRLLRRRCWPASRPRQARSSGAEPLRMSRLRRLSLTQWIFIGMASASLLGWLAPGRSPRAQAALHHLPPDDQVADRAADLRDAGRRHRGPRRRHEARRPARVQVDRLLRARDDDRARRRAARGEHHEARRRRDPPGARRRTRRVRRKAARRPSAGSSSTPSRRASSRPRPQNEVLQIVFFAIIFAVALSQVRGRPQEVHARRSARA